MASMSSPPSGTVTFLFTDIEGSTRLAQAFPAEWPAAQARHDQGTRAGVDCRREFALPFSELCSSDERHKASVGDWTSPGRPMDDCNSLYKFWERPPLTRATISKLNRYDLNQGAQCISALRTQLDSAAFDTAWQTGRQ